MMMAALGFFDRVGFHQRSVALGQVGELAVVFVQNAHIFLAEVFDVDQARAGALDGGDEFIELELNRQGFLVLRALNEKDHEKGDDGRTGVDDELPGVGETEHRAGNQPAENHGHGQREGPRAASGRGGAAGELLKQSGSIGHVDKSSVRATHGRMLPSVEPMPEHGAGPVATTKVGWHVPWPMHRALAPIAQAWNIERVRVLEFADQIGMLT